MSQLKIFSLGQVGFLFEFKNTKWIIDPYLSDYVEKLYGKSLCRQTKIPLKPEEIFDIDFILITHEHEDHCDPLTLKALAGNNKDCTVYCPLQCNKIVAQFFGEKLTNLKVGEESGNGDVIIKGLPAAHTSLEMQNGFSRWMGYEFILDTLHIYHAGDTIPFEELSDYLHNEIDLAFLPINERNFFRDKAGIVGNMTCREAIQWADQLNVRSWVPTHWDMFSGNDALEKELEIAAQHLNIQKYRWVYPGEEIIIRVE